MSIPDEHMQRTIQAAEDLRRAINEVTAAKVRLDLADDPDLVDAAIYEMKAAEKRLDYVIRQITRSFKEEDSANVLDLGRTAAAQAPA